MPGLTAGIHWRWVLADLDGSTITLLDRHVRQRSIEFRLNTPTQMSGVVSSDDPEINTLHTDGFPFLTEGDRLLYCFRRDYNGDDTVNDPWQCRAAGLIMELEDSALAENAESTLRAWDPWQLLYRRFVFNPNASAANQGNIDTRYDSVPANEIITNLLSNMIDYSDVSSPGRSADAFIDYGQNGSPPYEGTIEVLPAITHVFQKEMSIGEAFDQLCQRAACDIVLKPIYDPVNRPGYLAELSVYATRGQQRAEAIFAWDKPSRSVVSIDRGIDGNERANQIRFHAGQGGTVISPKTSDASIARFGEYWLSQFWVNADHENVETISGYADDLLAQVAQNKRTVSITVAPERCPAPFLEWDLGDTVRVFASDKFRSTQSGFQRVNAFTLDISDTALETVTNLEVYVPTTLDEPELAERRLEVHMISASQLAELRRRRVFGSGTGVIRNG